VIGPQQAGHVVAANRRARIRQVRNEAQAFAQRPLSVPCTHLQDQWFVMARKR
jgi:hypothetical protein